MAHGLVFVPWLANYRLEYVGWLQGGSKGKPLADHLEGIAPKLKNTSRIETSAPVPTHKSVGGFAPAFGFDTCAQLIVLNQICCFGLECVLELLELGTLFLHGLKRNSCFPNSRKRVSRQVSYAHTLYSFHRRAGDQNETKRTFIFRKGPCRILMTGPCAFRHGILLGRFLWPFEEPIGVQQAPICYEPRPRAPNRVEVANREARDLRQRLAAMTEEEVLKEVAEAEELAGYSPSATSALVPLGTPQK